MHDVVADPRARLLDSVSIERSRIEHSAPHIVLLCGGKVTYKEHPDAEDPPVTSLRHAITHAHPEFETFMPEEITDWHADGLFKNLMNFEQELAGICSLVVIILESAGSIAELGAFSQLKELGEKLVAIKSRDFENDRNLISFINLGILRFLREHRSSAVRNYPWNINSPHEISAQVVQDILIDIKDTLGDMPRTSVFNSNLSAHIVVLLYELTFVFTAIRESEYLSYLESFGIALSRDELRRKLFLLERFRILKKETYSDATFFMVGRSEFHRLRFALKDPAHRVDTLRLSFECLEFYKNDPKQRNRHRAIAQASAGLQR